VVEATRAGPFFHLGEHVEFEEALLEGEPCVFDHASAIGKWGPIFLELIALHEVTPELESRLRCTRTPTRSTGCSRCSRLGLRGGMGASR
jgi:hypothetical protein